MKNKNNDIEEKWRKKATTTVRFDLCYECKYYAPQKPYMPGVRCKFNLRPNVKYENGVSTAFCDVFVSK